MVAGCHQVIGFEESAPRSQVGGDAGLADADTIDGSAGQGGSGGTGAIGGAAGQGGSGGTGAIGGAAGFAGTCTDEAGPKTVEVPGGGVPVTMHATEVTRCQYAAFLATTPTQTVQTALCDWNVDFAPDAVCAAQTGDGPDAADLPQACVDWCDAAQYCASLAMRLCGAKSGGPSSEPDMDDATVDQYFDVCSSFGAHNYPYGGDPSVSTSDGFEEHACNGFDHGVNATLPVGSLSTCQSSVAGYEGVFDLSGNVAEWEDLCSQEGATRREDHCLVRGGGYGDNYAKQRCMDFSVVRRDERLSDLGFRCCD